MNITTEKITPAKAETWLNSNTHNRPLREGVAERYAADMAAGRWTRCPTPISFYEDGALADGQHRLFAITLSGATVEFPVMRGLSRADGLNIDTGFSRSLADNARIAGIDKAMTPSIVAAARAIAHGHDKGSRALSNSEKVEIVELHGEAARWAAQHVKRQRYLCSAPIMGAVGRAYGFGVDRAKLARFCEVLGNGFQDSDAESAAVALRNYLLRLGPAAATNANWTDTFLKAQNCIAYFLGGRKLTVVKSVSEEQYPLPKARRK